MKRVDYSYQDRAAEVVLKNALNKKYLASTLAACPGAGKTTISHKVLNKYFAKFPTANAVVLTEGQNVLKNQYLDELEDANVPIQFTYGAFGSDSQVEVGLPQSIRSYGKDSIDILIIDEAHNFFLGQMVQGIIKKYQPKHVILMTGSPTKYNAHNQLYNKKYGIYYIAAEELQKYGVFSGVDMDVTRVSDTKNAVETIKTVLRDAKSRRDCLDKVMVACPSIEYAKAVTAYLIASGRKVSLSTSDNDKDNEQIAQFKSGKTDTLVVVAKGILGFNDGEITFLADLRSSTNLDASNQLFCRLLRLHSKSLRKTYVRVSENKNFNAQVLTLHKIRALMKREIFVNFTGKNLRVA